MCLLLCRDDNARQSTRMCLVQCVIKLRRSSCLLRHRQRKSGWDTYSLLYYLSCIRKALFLSLSKAPCFKVPTELFNYGRNRKVVYPSHCPSIRRVEKGLSISEDTCRAWPSLGSEFHYKYKRVIYLNLIISNYLECHFN